MKKIVLLILCLIMACSFPLSANAEGRMQDTGYVKLPDDIEHIRNDVFSSIFKTKAQLQIEANQKSASLKENVLVNRLDDEKILAEDDNKLVLIYKVQYTYEEEATKSIASGYRVDSEVYAYNNCTINLTVRMDFYTDSYVDESGAQPRRIYKAMYAFGSGNTYYNYRLCVDKIARRADQFGVGYNGANGYPLNYDSNKSYSLYTYSDTNVVTFPDNGYTLIKDDKVGCIMVLGDFQVKSVQISPPYGTSTCGTITRQVGMGLGFGG